MERLHGPALRQWCAWLPHVVVAVALAAAWRDPGPHLRGVAASLACVALAPEPGGLDPDLRRWGCAGVGALVVLGAASLPLVLVGIGAARAARRFGTAAAAAEAAVWLVRVRAAVCRRAAALFTVHCDPLGRSFEPIPLVQSLACPFEAFTVEGARSEHERRVVAWAYRWDSAPDEDEWRQCLAAFRLPAVPDHILRLHDGGKAYDTAVAVSIRLGQGGAPGSREVWVVDADGAPRSSRAAGPILVGRLAPDRLVADGLALVGTGDGGPGDGGRAAVAEGPLSPPPTAPRGAGPGGPPGA